MTDLSRRGFLGAVSAAAVVAALPISASKPLTTTAVSTGAVNSGDVFTIAGVYAADPRTKAVRRQLQRFRVIGSTSRNRFMVEKSRG